MKQLFAIAILLIALQACKKEKEEPPKVDTPKEDVELKRITAFPWIIYKVTLGGTNIWDLGLIEACTKDDSYRFYKDSTMTQYENANVCSGSTDSSNNEWMFYDNKTKLIGSLLGIKDTANIVSLQDSSMNLLIDYDGSQLSVYFRKK